MPPSRKRIVDCVSVGKPARKNQKRVETIQFVMHDFKNEMKDNFEIMVYSPLLHAHGYNWRIGLYCFGRQIPNSKMFCALASSENCNIDTNISFCLKEYQQTRSHKFQYGERVFILWNSFQREKNLEEDGSLVVEVHIEITQIRESAKIWYPKELQQEETLERLYQDASSDSSDITFSVSEKVFRAHKNILALRGNKLFDIAEDHNNDDPIPIISVKPEIFKILLDFVYTITPSNIETKDIATDLLVAADCYGFIHLKLYAESVLVDKFLTAENAAELLVFADSHSCALLKEAATNLFVTDVKLFRKSKAWSQVRESDMILEELFASQDRYHTPVRIDFISPAWIMNLVIANVSDLRRKLEEKNLELDGSRKVLIERLKTYLDQIDTSDDDTSDDDTASSSNS